MAAQSAVKLAAQLQTWLLHPTLFFSRLLKLLLLLLFLFLIAFLFAGFCSDFDALSLMGLGLSRLGQVWLVWHSAIWER